MRRKTALLADIFYARQYRHVFIFNLPSYLIFHTLSPYLSTFISLFINLNTFTLYVYKLFITYIHITFNTWNNLRLNVKVKVPTLRLPFYEKFGKVKKKKYLKEHSLKIPNLFYVYSYYY